MRQRAYRTWQPCLVVVVSPPLRAALPACGASAGVAVRLWASHFQSWAAHTASSTKEAIGVRPCGRPCARRPAATGGRGPLERVEGCGRGQLAQSLVGLRRKCPSARGEG